VREIVSSPLILAFNFKYISFSGIETEHSTIAGTTLYMAPEGQLFMFSFFLFFTLFVGCLVMQAGQEHDDLEGKEESLEHGGGERNEVINKPVKYGRKADIWSLGMTLCELATGDSPYKNGAAAIYAVCISKQLPSFPGVFSNEAHNFLSRCLNYDVKARADAVELQMHIFMSPKVKLR
jgi:serine/threonine protein kinase